MIFALPKACPEPRGPFLKRSVQSETRVMRRYGNTEEPVPRRGRPKIAQYVEAARALLRTCCLMSAG
jgi:hypothetical protein